MTTYYVWSSSARNDSDATWNSSTLAYTNIAAATSVAYTDLVNNIIYVAHDHAYSATSCGTIYGGTISNPLRIICVNRSTGALATTATETITYAPDLNNIYYLYGINFITTTYFGYIGYLGGYWENSSIRFSSAGSTDYILLNTKNLTLKNSYLKTDGSSCIIRYGSATQLIWDGGGLVATSTNHPIALITSLYGESMTANIILKNLDLTSINTSGYLFGLPSDGNNTLNISVIGCKLPLNLPYLQTTSFNASQDINIKIISCNNGDGYWYFAEYYNNGNITQATNCYLNATYDGTNGYSAKMITNNVHLAEPLRYKLCGFYASANPTLTVEIIGTTTLQNDECWIEVEYNDATDEALRKVNDTSRQKVGWSGGSSPGTPTDLTTSTASWTEDLTGEIKQKIEVTISGGAAGIHEVYICLAKPSTTIYVDPAVTIS